MNLVFEPRELMMQWAIAKIPGGTPMKQSQDWQVIGLADETRLRCVALYHDFRDNSIEMSIAADTPKWASRGNIRAFLHYPFCQLGVGHVRAVIRVDNKRSRKMVERLGFKLEGVLRHAAKDGKNLILYGMIRKEANRWLNDKQEFRTVKSA
jgi:L-amino acid N-acyltransferase YncA